MPIAAGSRVGPYEIVGWLGAGGMGEVYRARDPRLGRDVAIKLIHERLATHPERLRRFEQEARAAGQLNHPGILAVHDVGTYAGAPYLVCELLEGESLRNRLRGGALAPRRAIDFARQAADALAAAHDKSIVHRDVKPDNLFVTSDGRIKILDFGIAKLTLAAEDGERPPLSPTETAPETVVGTAAYMSPEQVRGEPIDARSDIFSLGAVLCEMLTGRPAFARPSAADTAAAILKEEPAIGLPAGVPPALERIVTRCLEKSRDARFQSARDLAFALDSVATGRPETRRPLVAIGGAALLVLVASISFWASANRPPSPPDFANATFTRFSQWDGTEALAEISPDGRFVLFLADRDGEFDLYASQVGTGDFTNLTTTIPGMNAPGVVLRSFGFTNDGLEIWFSPSGQPGDRKMLMRLLSRTSRPFLGPGDAAPAWSPDGRRMVFINNKEGGGDPLFVADATGAEASQIYAGKAGDHNHNAVWSTDGNWIYFVSGVEPSVEMNIWRIRATGGTPERLTDQRTPINFLTPLDDRTVLFVARAADQSGPWLWTLDVPSKTTNRVSVGVNPYTSVSASHDGRRIVATVADPSVSLWTVPIADRPAGDRDVERHPLTAARAAAPRFAGNSLLFLSSRGAVDGLSRFQDGAVSEVWQDATRPLSEPVAVSRRSNRLAVVIRQGGMRRLATLLDDGTSLRTVPAASGIDVQGAAGAGNVDWSPDGAWLAVGGTDAKGPALFKVPVDGGVSIRLVEGVATDPIWSPDGKLIVYAGPFVDGQVELHAVDPGGHPVPMLAIRVRQGGYRFLPDGSGLVYLERTRSLDFWRFDIATGARRQLTHLSDRGLLHTFDIRPDGKQIVFDRTRENSNIALIELPKR